MIRETPKRDRHAFKQRWGDVQRQCADTVEKVGPEIGAGGERI